MRPAVVEDTFLLESVFTISIWGREKFKRSALALFSVIAIAAAMAKAPNMKYLILSIMIFYPYLILLKHPYFRS